MSWAWGLVAGAAAGLWAGPELANRLAMARPYWALAVAGTLLVLVIAGGGLGVWLQGRAERGRLGEVRLLIGEGMAAPGVDLPVRVEVQPRRSGPLSTRLLTLEHWQEIREQARSPDESDSRPPDHSEAVLDERVLHLPEVSAGIPATVDLLLRLPAEGPLPQRTEALTIRWVLRLRLQLEGRRPVERLYPLPVKPRAETA